METRHDLMGGVSGSQAKTSTCDQRQCCSILEWVPVVKGEGLSVLHRSSQRV